MRLGFLLVAIVLCGVCSGIPTDGSSTSSEASATASSAVTVSTTKEAPATSSKTSSTASSSSASSSTSTGGFDNDDDDDDDDDESQISGDGLNLPVPSAILLSSHHGHHVCIPDMLAFSLLGSRNYPFGSLFSYHHTLPQKLQQELMFLKAFTKAGQHVWKSIASGHPKHHGFENFAKVAGAISTGMNAFTRKGAHGLSSIANEIPSGLPPAAQLVGAASH